MERANGIELSLRAVSPNHEARVGFRPPNGVCKYLVRSDLLEAEVGIGQAWVLSPSYPVQS
jgi:hypothetical protein